MILELNQWLTSDKYAYHINRDFMDNRIENLKIIDITPVGYRSKTSL